MLSQLEHVILIKVMSIFCSNILDYVGAVICSNLG